MAFLRQRNGKYSLTFKWRGKSFIKALGTTDEQKAKQIMDDSEAQLDRIRQGKSVLAAKLLADGFSILDVLFGSPEVALHAGKESSTDNPLTIGELVTAYVAQLPSSISADHRYTIQLWLRHVHDYLGDDRPVMSLTMADLEGYRKKRVGPKGQNTASFKKEITWLKSAIDWAVETKLLGSSPIPRWPTVKVQPRKRFEWKSDIQAMIADHEFKDEKEKQAFLDEMKARLVLTAEDMKNLVKLSKEKMPELMLPLKVVCSSGIRRKEMVSLKKADFDPRRGTLMVGSAKQSKTEEITYRNIVLGEEVLKDLREHHKALPKSERLLFPMFKENSPAYRNRWVEWETNSDGSFKMNAKGKRIPKKAGDGKIVAAARKQIPERLRAERASRMLDELVARTEFELMSGWHCLRHSFISLCVAKGTDWPQIAEWVGHVNQRTTQLYTHFNTAESKKRMESLEITFH